ncbi:LAFA_0G14532g1_1 [Lachancea sp. 'fantastica']|nr:LAFA_0G14532g1_1 [Lachancea sp. 'fantastica']
MSDLLVIPLLLNCGAVLYQRRYNRLHKSIAGLSYDLYVLSFTSYLLSVYCGFNYVFSTLLHKQLHQRFPVFFGQDKNKIPVSTTILLSDVVNLICASAVLKQLFDYRSSSRDAQHISLICVIIIAACAVFSVFTYACATLYLPGKDSGRFGIFYLDHVNYSWILATFLSSFRLMPQLTVNFMERSTQGISFKFVVLSTVSAIFQLVVEFCNQKRTHPYTPLNGKPLFEPLLNLIFLLSVIYQVHHVYHNRTYGLANRSESRIS